MDLINIKLGKLASKQERFYVFKLDKKGNKKYLRFKEFKPALGICQIAFTKNPVQGHKFSSGEMRMLHVFGKLITKHYKDLHIETHPYNLRTEE